MEMWTVEIQQKNGEWFNYFVDEGLWWDTCWFQTEEEALSEFWKIMNEYDMNWEDVSSTLGMSIYNNGNLTILGQDSLNEDSEPNIYCYRIIQTDEYIEKLEWLNEIRK
jgi:hypothetical protein